MSKLLGGYNEKQAIHFTERSRKMNLFLLPLTPQINPVLLCIRCVHVQMNLL